MPLGKSKPSSKGGSASKAPASKVSKPAAKGKPLSSIFSIAQGAAKVVSSAKKTNLVKGGKTQKVVNKVVSGIDKMAGSIMGISPSSVPGTPMSMFRSKGGKRHRRGVVPKTVKKWATRYARKRKQAEKVIKNVFGSDGSKLLGPRKKKSYGSPGVITRAELSEAMRR